MNRPISLTCVSLVFNFVLWGGPSTRISRALAPPVGKKRHSDMGPTYSNYNKK